MPTLPPLDCLRFFDAAARHQSFSRAAEELQVTPAAVSHRVRMLEAHIGSPLFIRRARSIRLNRRGLSYHADIKRILGEIVDATRRLRRMRTPVRRTPPQA